LFFKTLQRYGDFLNYVQLFATFFHNFLQVFSKCLKINGGISYLFLKNLALSRKKRNFVA